MGGRLPTYAPPVTEETPSRPPLDVRATLLDRDGFVVVVLLAAVCVVLFPFTDAFRGGALLAYPASAVLLLVTFHHSRVRPSIFRAVVVILVLVGVGTVLSSIARLFNVGAERHMIALSSFLYALLFAVAFPVDRAAGVPAPERQHEHPRRRHRRLPDHRPLLRLPLPGHRRGGGLGVLPRTS